MNKYNFYMQKCSKDGTLVDGTLKENIPSALDMLEILVPSRLTDEKKSASPLVQSVTLPYRIITFSWAVRGRENVIAIMKATAAIFFIILHIARCLRLVIVSVLQILLIFQI